MFETPVTVVGRVITDVTTRLTTAGDKVANFRIACQERRYDKEQQQWVDGDRMYVRVVGWRTLAEGVTALHKGDQVVVTGRLKLTEYTTEEGARRTSPEIDARAIGPDLAWHTVIVNRRNWTPQTDHLPLPAEHPGHEDETAQAA
jgi:single-strand DNA-binding protein